MVSENPVGLGSCTEGYLRSLVRLDSPRPTFLFIS